MKLSDLFTYSEKVDILKEINPTYTIEKLDLWYYDSAYHNKSQYKSAKIECAFLESERKYVLEFINDNPVGEALNKFSVNSVFDRVMKERLKSLLINKL